MGALVVGRGVRALCLAVLYMHIAMALPLPKAVALCRMASLGLDCLVVLWHRLLLVWAWVVVLSGRCHGWQCKDGNQS